MLDIKKLITTCKKYVDIDDIAILAEDIKKISEIIVESNTVSGIFIIVPRKYLNNICGYNLPGVDFTYKVRGIFDMGRLYGMDKGDFTLVHIFYKGKEEALLNILVSLLKLQFLA